LLLSVHHHIRQLVELLEAHHQWKNTWVMYTSDNGFQLGQHRLGSDKRQLYEHDIRVPFIVTGTGVPSNTHNYDHIVMNIDIAPTIYHLVTGTSLPPLPTNMDGTSIVPFLLANDHNNNKITSPASIKSRHDFLVSYHGEGYPPSGMYNCPPPDPPNYHGGDASNNTYHCVRTIMTEKEDSIYCRFQDEDDFVEYYDLTEDQWQLTNSYDRLSQEEKGWYEKRLSQLGSCRGPSCHEYPKRESLPHFKNINRIHDSRKVPQPFYH
jgi:N-acetylglucosamine-6-sulfatase